MKGTVVKVLPDRGFGFVRGEDGIQRFFSARECGPKPAFDLIAEGAPVEFEPDDAAPRGPRANAVRAARPILAVSQARP